MCSRLQEQHKEYITVITIIITIVYYTHDAGKKQQMDRSCNTAPLPVASPSVWPPSVGSVNVPSS